MYLVEDHETGLETQWAAPVSAAPRLMRLVLNDFRSYANLDLAIDGKIIVLHGENGAGKTNILEALSLLTPGRGLRRADLKDCARAEPGKEAKNGFAVFAELGGALGKVQLGTGIELQGEGFTPRRCRIDREPRPSLNAFAEYLRVLWLTPAMDGLFSGPAGERRRFLDRLVLSTDADHGARANSLERALRNRNRLLEQGSFDQSWLEAAEREIAELGVAVAAARVATVKRLKTLITSGIWDNSAFPWAGITLHGDVERMVAQMPALEAEDRFRQILRQNRARDAAAGRCLIGPQASDLLVRHGPKQTEAATCSTGEQKALLIGLVLAHAKLVEEMSGLAPLLLLDEVAAHLDFKRRISLFECLEKLGGQAWLTGAEAAVFSNLSGKAQIFCVSPGHAVQDD